MIKENVILGCPLIAMGAAQIWLRFGPWAKEQKAEEEALAKRRQAAQADARNADEEDADGGQDRRDVVLTDRGSKLWTKWTAILGPLGIAVGLALLIWGLVGE